MRNVQFTLTELIEGLHSAETSKSRVWKTCFNGSILWSIVTSLQLEMDSAMFAISSSLYNDITFHWCSTNDMKQRMFAQMKVQNKRRSNFASQERPMTSAIFMLQRQSWNIIHNSCTDVAMTSLVVHDQSLIGRNYQSKEMQFIASLCFGCQTLQNLAQDLSSSWVLCESCQSLACVFSSQFIEEWIAGRFSLLFVDEEYNVIIWFLNCFVWGSCAEDIIRMWDNILFKRIFI